MALLLAAALLMTSVAPSSAEKMSVWIQSDPDHPTDRDLRDSARDMIDELESDVLELAADKESAQVVVTVTERFQLAGVRSPGYRDFSIVRVRLEVAGLGEPRMFQGRGATWKGAANNARTRAEKWLKGRFALDR